VIWKWGDLKKKNKKQTTKNIFLRGGRVIFFIVEVY
jgi:hypothetical protein